MKKIVSVIIFLLHALWVCPQVNNNADVSEGNKLILSVGQKLFGLSEIWSLSKNEFVYYDELKIDWDSLYATMIPKVLAAKSTMDYYNELRYFASFLHDGHTGVWYPASFYKKEYAFAPLKTRKVENSVLISGLLNDTLKKMGLERGMEILKINGMEVHEYAQKNIAPFEGASSQQGKELMVYSVYLLNGNVDETLQLTLKDKLGKIRECKITRSLTRKKISCMTFEQMRDSTGILTINDFSNKDFAKIFDTIYPKILQSKRLIIDIRENGGGDSEKGYYVLKHLLPNGFVDAASSYRQSIMAFKAWGVQTQTFFQIPSDFYESRKDISIYNKQVALLIDRNTYSAAEDFAMIFDYMKRGVLIGSATGGSTGQPLSVLLPGGGTFRYCIKKDTYPDGKIFVGKGIQPGINVAETLSDYIDGIDKVMETALSVLNRK